VKRLESIMMQASELSYSLWVQKKNLGIKRMSDMNETFMSSDVTMEAHQLHNKLLEASPAALDGKPILIFAHPAVLSYGSTDSSDFSVKSVLKPATCWMG
jgi:hypothetical protein